MLSCRGACCDAGTCCNALAIDSHPHPHTPPLPLRNKSPLNHSFPVAGRGMVKGIEQHTQSDINSLTKVFLVLQEKGVSH